MSCARLRGRMGIWATRKPSALPRLGQRPRQGLGEGVELRVRRAGHADAAVHRRNAGHPGKDAQVGQRLIDGVAKSMAESFFKRFDEEMNRRHGPPPDEAAAEEPGKLKRMWGKLTGSSKAEDAGST